MEITFKILLKPHNGFTNQSNHTTIARIRRSMPITESNVRSASNER